MKTREKIITLLNAALQKENEKLKYAVSPQIQTIIDVKQTINIHLNNLENHLKNFDGQVTSKETVTSISKVIDALLYIEQAKLDLATENKNADKIKLHEDKINGLKEIKNHLVATPLNEAISTASNKYPLLTKGVFSIIKTFFNEIAPGWENVKLVNGMTTSSVTDSNRLFSGSSEQPTIIKIVFLGDSAVGKTALMYQYSYGIYDNHQPTIGVEYLKKTIGNNKLDLWDLTGMPRFYNVISSYVTNTPVALLTFDITNNDSFKNVKKKWHDLVKQKSSDAQMILVGTKSDLQHERKVSIEEAKAYAEKIGADYFEVSAKNNTNINELFARVLELNVENKNTLKLI